MDWWPTMPVAVLGHDPQRVRSKPPKSQSTWRPTATEKSAGLRGFPRQGMALCRRRGEFRRQAGDEPDFIPPTVEVFTVCSSVVSLPSCRHPCSRPSPWGDRQSGQRGPVICVDDNNRPSSTRAGSASRPTTRVRDRPRLPVHAPCECPQGGGIGVQSRRRGGGVCLPPWWCGFCPEQPYSTPRALQIEDAYHAVIVDEVQDSRRSTPHRR